MPPPPPRHQLEVDDVRTTEVDILDGKVLRLAVEYRDATKMSSRRRHRRHPKAAGFLHVNYVGELGFLQYATINLSLRQPAN